MLSKISKLEFVVMSISILPSGHLFANHSGMNGLPEEVVEWFLQSVEIAILRLAAAKLEVKNYSPVFSYWQNFARMFIERSRHASHADAYSLTVSDHEELSDFLEQAPPMLGGEYLSISVLEGLWSKLSEVLVIELKPFNNNLFAYLASYNVDWQKIGSVCFHLAENKSNKILPFAFLATYTKNHSSKNAQHVPLGQALKEYACENDKEQLIHLLSPVQRAAQAIPFVKELIDTAKIFHPQAWSVNDAYKFLKATQKMEEAGVKVKVPNWWNVKRPPRPQLSIAIGNKATNQMGLTALLDFNVQYTLANGESISRSEIDSLIQSQENLIHVKGQWVEIDSQKIAAVLSHWDKVKENVQENGLTFAESLRLIAGGSPNSELIAFPEDINQWSKVIEGEWLRETLNKLRHPDQIADNLLEDVLQANLNATLRPYQLSGVQWLWFLYQLGFGGCLADDMGLGKTIQVLSLLLMIKHSNNPKQVSLLVVPASLLGNWQREIQKFAPGLDVFIAHSTAFDKETLKQEAITAWSKKDLVITTYGNVYRLPWMSNYQWQTIILDEAQNIKNPSTKQTSSIKALKGKVRFLLTGTPVENKLLDLWSLFDFCSPGLLGSRKEFSNYGKASTDEHGEESRFYGVVRKLVSPYILRRLKTDKTIIADLPDKTEFNIDCFLSKQQILLYQKAVSELEERLNQGNLDGIERKGVVLSYLTRLKQICNHPSQWLGHGEYDEQGSGKFMQLRNICETIAAKQEKVLIFTQYKEIIPHLHDFVAQIFGVNGLMLHGQTPIKERQKLVENFQNEAGPPFFVLSIKAGGTGLTLTKASHVIHFDRWWNPAVENQATDRAYRIGQKKNVLVHKFICQGTLEEKINNMIAKKKALTSDILESDGGNFLTELDSNEVLKIISLDIHKMFDDK